MVVVIFHYAIHDPRFACEPFAAFLVGPVLDKQVGVGLREDFAVEHVDLFRSSLNSHFSFHSLSACRYAQPLPRSTKLFSSRQLLKSWIAAFFRPRGVLSEIAFSTAPRDTSRVATNSSSVRIWRACFLKPAMSMTFRLPSRVTSL